MTVTHRILSVACLLAAPGTTPLAWAEAGLAAGPQTLAAVDAPLQLEWDARMRQEQVDDGAPPVRCAALQRERSLGAHHRGDDPIG